jgi:heme O synthase-like polyprenyltransferase
MRPRDSISALTAYLELTKARITGVVVFTTATGLWLAPVRLPVSLVLLTVFAVAGLLRIAAAGVHERLRERSFFGSRQRTNLSARKMAYASWNRTGIS